MMKGGEYREKPINDVNTLPEGGGQILVSASALKLPWRQKQRVTDAETEGEEEREMDYQTPRTE